MSKLGDLLAIPVGLFIVKQITDRIDKQEATKPTFKEPVIPTTGPAGPDVKDFKLIPESFTAGQNQGSGLTFSPITKKTLASFDPGRKAEIKPFDPDALVAQPISGGGPFRLDFGGRSLADILQGRR